MTPRRGFLGALLGLGAAPAALAAPVSAAPGSLRTLPTECRYVDLRALPELAFPLTPEGEVDLRGFRRLVVPAGVTIRFDAPVQAGRCRVVVRKGGKVEFRRPVILGGKPPSGRA